MNIEQAIIKLTKLYCDKFDLTPYSINDGYCVEFAADVIKAMGGYKDNLFELTSDMFWSWGDDEEEYWAPNIIKVEGGIWNKEMLDLHGMIDLKRFPDGLSHHSWVYYNGKHYDAQALKGVKYWYQLPIFNNNLNEEIKLDINKGDTILTGKWRNKKVVVKDIGEDENGLPTVNGKGILKIRIQKLMKNLKEQALIKLIEKYSGKKVVLEKMLPPTSEAINNIRKIYAKDEELPQRIASVIKNWYSGSFMGQKLPANINSKMLEVFNTLKELYSNGNVSKVYRALMLKVPPTATAEKIRTMVAIKTGVAMIQSWSTERSGAEWYFKHFASEQNHSDRQKHGWAWVLVEAQVGEGLELLTTATVMNQYLSDCSLGLKQGVIDFVEPEFMEMAAEHYNSDDMLKQHEVICKASNKVMVKVLDVMVEPLSPDQEEEDRTIEDLLSMLQRR